MNPSDKYTQDYLSGKELEKTSEELLDQLHDRTLRKRWQQQLEKDYQIGRTKGTTTVIRRLRPWLAVAAGVAILLAAFYWLMPAQQDINSTVMAHLEVPFPNSMGRKSDDLVSTARNQAINAYISKDYTTAAQAGEQVVQVDSLAAQGDFLYLGLSYLYQQPPNAAAAIPHLQRAADWTNGEYTKESKWFLALAYVQADNKPSARALLQDIIEQRLWQWKAAKELLNQIPE